MTAKRSPWWIVGMLAAALVVLLILAAAFIRLTYFAAPATEPQTRASAPAFEGRIVALSDLDQAAGGYANGKLMLLPGQIDQLSIIDGARVTSTPVSNSVIGWVTTMRRSPDGRFAYVAEIRGPAPPGTVEIPQPYANFPAGNLVTVVDVSATAPRVVARIAAGRNPGTLDVTPDGATLAVGSDNPVATIKLWSMVDGVPVGESVYLDIPFPPGSRPGVRAIRFHPSGDFLAANLSDQEIVFFAVRRDENGRITGLVRHGAPVRPSGSGTVLTEVEWTPDGRFLIVPDVRWGAQGTWTMLTTEPGRLLSIRFDSAPAARHVLAGSATVGRSPEGMEISPDGRHAITVNMERSYLPDVPGLSWLFGGKSAGSVSLIAIDPETGRLTASAPLRFAAALPEDVTFDLNGRGVALTVYERPGDGMRERGYVDFWRIESDGAAARLVRTPRSVPLPRGVHDLMVVLPQTR